MRLKQVGPCCCRAITFFSKNFLFCLCSIPFWRISLYTHAPSSIFPVQWGITRDSFDTVERYYPSLWVFYATHSSHLLLTTMAAGERGLTCVKADASSSTALKLTTCWILIHWNHHSAWMFYLQIQGVPKKLCFSPNPLLPILCLYICIVLHIKFLMFSMQFYWLNNHDTIATQYWRARQNTNSWFFLTPFLYISIFLGHDVQRSVEMSTITLKGGEWRAG